MSEQPQVVTDLIATGADLDELVAGLEPDQWALPTPAPGWTVAHQIAHLAAVFRMAATAAGDPAGFEAFISRLTGDFGRNVEDALAAYLAEPPKVLLDRWRAERTAAERAIAALPMDHLVPWLVRPLPAAVLAMAGMMEEFAHGRDVADAVGFEPRYTDRIGHLVGFAVRTWDFGYQARQLPTPDVQFRYELTAPSGQVWAYGPPEAEQRITGPAVDFCLLVTRRRHRDDLAVKAVGREADEWLSIAQAYRGPAGPGRRPGQFAR